MTRRWRVFKLVTLDLEVEGDLNSELEAVRRAKELYHEKGPFVMNELDSEWTAEEVTLCAHCGDEADFEGDDCLPFGGEPICQDCITLNKYEENPHG